MKDIRGKGGRGISTQMAYQANYTEQRGKELAERINNRNSDTAIRRSLHKEIVEQILIGKSRKEIIKNLRENENYEIFDDSQLHNYITYHMEKVNNGTERTKHDELEER